MLKAFWELFEENLSLSLKSFLKAFFKKRVKHPNFHKFWFKFFWNHKDKPLNILIFHDNRKNLAFFNCFSLSITIFDYLNSQSQQKTPTKFHQFYNEKNFNKKPARLFCLWLMYRITIELQFKCQRSLSDEKLEIYMKLCVQKKKTFCS
jgi:hypothetical protein